MSIRVSDWQKRGLRTAIVGLVGSLFLLRFYQRAAHDPCIAFRHSDPKDLARTVIVCGLIWWALALILVFPPKASRWRLYAYLGLGAAIFLLLFVPNHPTVDPADTHWALEAGAIHVFKESAQTLDKYRMDHRQFPASFEVTPSSAEVRQYFDFYYVPVRNRKGTVETYRIQALPAHPPCGCNESLTLAQDGNIYRTLQARSANETDELYRRVSW